MISLSASIYMHYLPILTLIREHFPSYLKSDLRFRALKTTCPEAGSYHTQNGQTGFTTSFLTAQPPCLHKHTIVQQLHTSNASSLNMTFQSKPPKDCL